MGKERQIDGSPTLDWLSGFCVRPSARAKHVRLKVLPPGRVEVVVPRGFDQRQLPAILARHEAWLSRTVEKVRSDYGGHQPLVAPRMIELAAVGRSYHCEYRIASHSGCRMVKDRLHVRYGGDLDWRIPLRAWLADQGRAHLAPWCERVSRELGLAYRQVSIRGQKTRWGSCSVRKHISLNYGLLFLEPELVRYLLIHELCHTVHMNHSKAYWGLVAHYEPDYRRLDEGLRDAASRVPAWARKD